MSLLDIIQDPDEPVRAGRRIDGVAVGIVTDNRDPDGLARVKVQMPWLGPDAETDWVKLATLYAGDGRGSVFLPEVGDEVLLAFEHGDVNYPYVIGVLWNTGAQPPESNAAGGNDTKLIRSRAGHVLEFSDHAGGEKVSIRSQGGHLVELSDAPGAARITISDGSGSNILTLETTPGTVTLKAGLRIALEAPEVAITAQRFSVSAQVMGSIEATGPLTLRGAIINLN